MFQDCYFGEFGVPDDVTSSAVTASIEPIPPSQPATKRTAKQAGLVAPAPAAQAPKSRAAASTPRAAASSSISTKPAASLTDAQKIERRERNREHAKRSRLRKKFLLESLQEQIDGLQGEIHTRRILSKLNCPTEPLNF